MDDESEEEPEEPDDPLDEDEPEEPVDELDEERDEPEPEDPDDEPDDEEDDLEEEDLDLVRERLVFLASLRLSVSLDDFDLARSIESSSRCLEAAEECFSIGLLLSVRALLSDGFSVKRLELFRLLSSYSSFSFL